MRCSKIFHFVLFANSFVWYYERNEKIIIIIVACKYERSDPFFLAFDSNWLLCLCLQWNNISSHYNDSGNHSSNNDNADDNDEDDNINGSGTQCMCQFNFRFQFSLSSIRFDVIETQPLLNQFFRIQSFRYV